MLVDVLELRGVHNYVLGDNDVMGKPASASRLYDSNCWGLVNACMPARHIIENSPICWPCKVSLISGLLLMTYMNVAQSSIWG
jgi:hypothetical protein